MTKQQEVQVITILELYSMRRTLIKQKSITIADKRRLLNHFNEIVKLHQTEKQLAKLDFEREIITDEIVLDMTPTKALRVLYIDGDIDQFNN